MLDDLCERRVGLVLARHAAHLDIIEAPVHADGAARRATTDDPVQVITKSLEVHWLGQRLRCVRLEDGYDGERGFGLVVDGVSHPVRLYLVEVTVEADHLSVEGVERAEAEISILPEFGEADIALVLCFQQGVDGRCLKERVVEMLVPSEVPLPEILDVQRTHERAIDRHQAYPAFIGRVQNLRLSAKLAAGALELHEAGREPDKEIHDFEDGFLGLLGRIPLLQYASRTLEILAERLPSVTGVQ